MRRPWFAFLLSAVFPGLGQLHAGAPVRACAALLWATVLLPPAAIALMVPLSTSPAAVMSAFAINLGLYLIVAVDAWLVARASREQTGRGWIRMPVYLLFVVAGVAVVLAVRAWVAPTFWYRTFSTPSASMSPTIEPADYVIADMTPVEATRLQRGTVVVFRPPGNEQLWIRRLVGLPGDRLEIRSGLLRVNDTVWTLAGDTEGGDGRSWGVRSRPAGTPDFGPVEIPPERVFLLGDNRPNSRDSRDFGTLPADRVEGRLLRVWFSVEPHPDGRLSHPLAALLTGRVRWDRIGAEPFTTIDP